MAEINLNDGRTRKGRMVRTLSAHASTVLPDLFPGGEFKGDEYWVVSPLRDDEKAGSFSINSNTLFWNDFADSGGTIFDLVHKTHYPDDATDDNACKFLMAMVERFKNAPIDPPPVVRRKRVIEAIPIEADACEVLLTPDGEEVTGQWAYHDADGSEVFKVLRYVGEGGEKGILPVRVGVDGLVHKGLPQFTRGLPVYNLHRLEKGCKVVWGEGEKVADHLQTLYPECVATTTQGGSSAPFKSDLSAMSTVSHVTLFPDADKTGAEYMTKVGVLLLAMGVTVEILDHTGLNWIGGVDVADFPDLTAEDYAGCTIPFDDWLLTQLPAATLDHVVAVGRGLRRSDYQLNRKALAKLAKVSVAYLDERVGIKDDREGDEGPPPPTAEELAIMRKERRDELWPRVRHLAERKDILEVMMKFVRSNLNVAGDGEHLKLTYLAMISRLQKSPPLHDHRPVSLLSKGASSGGKSYEIKTILQLFKKDYAYYTFGTVSDKAMIYSADEYAHTVLFFSEVDQLEDRDSAIFQTIKKLLTEGFIEHQVVEKNEETGKFETRIIIKEGPTGMIGCTTLPALATELENRTVSFFIDESEKHTIEVLRVRAHAATGEAMANSASITPELQKWQEFDEWLSLNPYNTVAIEYLGVATGSIDNTPVRYRRDIPDSFYGLIRASAILHQKTREVHNGFIVANLDDYENAWMAMEPSLRNAASELSNPNDEKVLVGVLKVLDESPENKSGVALSTREIARATGVAQKTVVRALARLMKLGFIEPVGGIGLKKAKKFKKGAESYHQNSAVLPTKLELVEILKIE
jgi:hypothetical protein